MNEKLQFVENYTIKLMAHLEIKYVKIFLGDFLSSERGARGEEVLFITAASERM